MNPPEGEPWAQWSGHPPRATLASGRSEMNDKTKRPPDQRRDGAARGALRAAGRQLELIAPPPSPEEAAAIVAALERFIRATAPGPAAPAAAPDRWLRVAILEGVRREDEWDASDPWINT